ncbi:anhydro-N-acetylmuramic acid kinase [Pseudomaricurvus sp.]|uniref:anhydro-N-acetylmuramic acid kinase n=1 Tax=Pseudomaricurvus sp. TaxID=2004510 RepID=UPI003F6C613D
MKEHYIGLMSGTSADGIDATLIECGPEGQLTVIDHLETPYPDDIRQSVLDLCQPGDNEVERLGQLDQRLGLAFAEAVQQLLHQNQLSASDIKGIGSHGQTVRHHPQGSVDHPFTLQIGDPNRIAEITGITTVADFRRRDMAAGGGGAPLAPAFHQAVFSSKQERRVIVNIGGIANATNLGSELASGFDTGPGNTLMDGWVQRHNGHTYDACGQWAESGKVNAQLLTQLLAHPYFTAPPPKSTGREDFNLHWLEAQLAVLHKTHPQEKIAAEDVQATLLELTAASIIDGITQHIPQHDHIYICGGGARNTALMSRLNQLSHVPVSTTSTLGIDPQQVEGAAFAWLARQTLHHLTGNKPAATGADREVILGGIYPAG